MGSNEGVTKQREEITDEIREKAAQNLGVSIIQDGFLDWSKSCRGFGMDEWDRQNLFNEECNRVLKEQKCQHK